MEEKQYMADRIRVRRDSAANWQSANPRLALGEIGIELDTGLIKVGSTGTATYSDIVYAIFNNLEAILDITRGGTGAGTVEDALANLNGVQKSKTFATTEYATEQTDSRTVYEYLNGELQHQLSITADYDNSQPIAYSIFNTPVENNSPQAAVQLVFAWSQDKSKNANWNNSTAYPQGTIVKNGTILYRAIIDVPSGTALTNSTYWESSYSGKKGVGELLMYYVKGPAAKEFNPAASGAAGNEVATIAQVQTVATAFNSFVSALSAATINYQKGGGTTTIASALDDIYQSLSGKEGTLSATPPLSVQGGDVHLAGAVGVRFGGTGVSTISTNRFLLGKGQAPVDTTVSMVTSLSSLSPTTSSITNDKYVITAGGVDRALKAQKALITALQTAVGTEGPSPTGIFEDIKNLQDDLDDVESGLSTAETKITALQTAIGTTQPTTQIPAMQGNIAALQTAIGTTQPTTQIPAMQSAITALQDNPIIQSGVLQAHIGPLDMEKIDPDYNSVSGDRNSGDPAWAGGYGGSTLGRLLFYILNGKTWPASGIFPW
jgi:hypothetical protein